MKLSQEQWRGHLAMLCFSALVAGSFSLGHIVANEIAPPAITAVRFGLAAVLMGVFVAIGPGFKRQDFHAPWRYLVLGGLFGLYFVLMFEGLKTAKPISAAAVFTLVPLMAAFAGYFLLRQITTRRMAVALGIAAGGSLWVIFRGDLSALAQLDVGKGELIYFVGCISHAVYTPMIRKLNRGEGPLVFTFGTLIGGSVLLVAIGYQDIIATNWAALPAIVWITLAYLVVFATAASFLAVQYATLRLPSAKVMAYAYLTPSWVILWEAGLGNGWPTSLVMLGVGATVAALFILLKDEANA
ncbi:MAG: drug/metabolite transporter (DMT)-like permease [Paracoccaceae bacterium]|jgi:drug/metabolite transporter (DMT)-like permease